MKTQDEWNAEHDHLMALLDEATTALKQYPGVIAVEIGIKETGRELTQILSFRVYVQKKIATEQLAPDERIPNEIFGVKTDVIPYDVPVLTANDSKFRPLKGGVQIGNDKDSGGTLGCIARRNTDNSFVALGNAHVMLGGHQPSDSGIEVGQPYVVDACCCTCDVIGEVVAQQLDGIVDCAISSIKSGISPTNLIRALLSNGNDGELFGSNNAVIGSSLVTKVGKTSDRTTGTIVSLTHQTNAVPAENTPARTRQILIRPETGIRLFQEKGDSGAVLLNSDAEVIGLMWGAYINPSHPLNGHGIACPIADVLAALNISIPFGSINTGFGPPVLKIVEPALEQAESATLISYLKEHLSQTSQGRNLLQLVDHFGSEILYLVNNNRAVMLMWHRKHGPAYLAAFGRSAKLPSYHIPSAIEDVSRQQLFMSMAAVLSDQGSSALQNLIDQFFLPLLHILHDCDTVEAMLIAIQEIPALQLEIDMSSQEL